MDIPRAGPGPARRLARLVALVVGAGVVAPALVVLAARGRTVRGRAPFVVADALAHALLSLLFLRSGTAPRKTRRREPVAKPERLRRGAFETHRARFFGT